jgi:hypothetical protein
MITTTMRGVHRLGWETGASDGRRGVLHTSAEDGVTIIWTGLP